MTINDYIERLASYDLQRGDMIRVSVKTKSGKVIRRLGIVRFVHNGIIECIQKKRNLTMYCVDIHDVEIVERFNEIIGGEVS